MCSGSMGKEGFNSRKVTFTWNLKEIIGVSKVGREERMQPPVEQGKHIGMSHDNLSSELPRIRCGQPRSIFWRVATDG